MKKNLFKALAAVVVLGALTINVKTVSDSKKATNFKLSAFYDVNALTFSSTESSTTGSSTNSSTNSSTTGSSTNSSTSGNGRLLGEKEVETDVTYSWDATAGIWILGTKYSVQKTVKEKVKHPCCMDGGVNCVGAPPCF